MQEIPLGCRALLTPPAELAAAWHRHGGRVDAAIARARADTDTEAGFALPWPPTRRPWLDGDPLPTSQ